MYSKQIKNPVLNLKITLFLILCACIAPQLMWSQHVQVNIVIPPPYPIHLEDYMSFSNQTVVTLQNTSNEVRQIKLITSVTGDNGVAASVKPSFVPVMPIVLNPMETRVLSGAQIRSINNNIKENDIEVSGANQSTIMQTETLPEGSYTICIEPLDFNTSVSYASPAGPGCTQIFLTNYDTPEIITPLFEQDVTATTPQFVNFAWTPSGIASNTRYRFELVDMEFNKLMNINDAFANPSVQMHYTQNNLLIPNLQYDISKPPLIPGHQYAVRVVAYDPSNQTLFKNNGEGPVSTFYYLPNIINHNNVMIDPNLIFDGGGQDPDNDYTVFINMNINDIKLPDPPVDDPPQDLGDCVADCTLPEPQGAPGSIIQGQPVQVGLFQMEIAQLNGNSGEGTIFIPFLKTKVKVTFTNLQVTAGNTMLGGQVYAKMDQGTVIPQNVSSSENANLESLYSQLPALLNEVQSNAKKISMFDGNQPPTQIPFSLDRKNMDMVIVGLIFTPTRAYMNVVMGLETITSSLNPYLGISQNGMGIRPNGFCEDTELQIGLTADQELPIVQNGAEEWVKLNFKGAPAGNKTHVTFTCAGIQKISIDADLKFGRDIVIPVNQNGDEQNGNVSVEIKTTLENNFKDWYLEGVAMKPSKFFTLPSMKGFAIEANQIIYDQHTNYTPQGLVFHPQHPSAEGNSQLWKGLFIGNLIVQFPTGFNKDGQPLKVAVDNMLLDKTGMWGKISVSDVLNIGQGDLGGWAFSIDQFHVDIQESSIVSGGFGGNIELPITTLGVPYDIQLAGQQGNEFTFGISPNTDIEVNMWIAQMTIGPSSSINITKVGNGFVPSAQLNGNISIGWTKQKSQNMEDKPSVSKFQLPSLSVEGMKIITQNGQPKMEKFGLPAIENLNLPQGEFLAFKINLTDLAIVNDNEGQNGLKLSLSLGFDNSGNGGTPLIGGATTFTLFPKIENKKFKFNKTALDEVSIDVTVGPAVINGGLQLYNGDATYGEGFRGFISVQMPPLGLEDLSFTLQVGTAPQQFRYWMFDASIKLNQGIPCGPGVALYGFGGGFWYNMTREGPENKEGDVAININDMVDVAEVNMSPGATANQITYTPSEGTFGFKANVILGLQGASAAFNADVGLAMELESNFAFNFIEFYGTGYLMQDMTNRGEALVTGGVHIKVTTKNADPNGPILMGKIDVAINVNTLVDVEASLYLEFMFSSSDWYVNFGSWDQNADLNTYDPKTDPKRNRLAIKIPLIKADAQFNCYFMVGTTIPSNLPPLPQNVKEFFPQGAGPLKPGTMSKAKGGLGFAAGAGLHLDVNFKFAIIYVDVQFDMGFDALVEQVSGQCGDIQNPGIGGWYAKGQAYAYCHVEGGLEIDLWFFSGKAPFVAFTAGALLQVQGPNPTWIKGQLKFEVQILGGLIKINTQVRAEIGEKCDDGLGNPFDDIPIVSYVDPEDKSKKVDCFTNPQIVFNFPKVPFKYEVMDENDPEKTIIRGFSIKMKSYKFTYVDPDSDKTITLGMGDPQYAKDGYSCLLLPDDILPGLTEISYEIVTAGYEHHMNGYLISNSIKEAFPDQITKGVFTTDSFPDAIRIEDIVYSIPGLGQRYFLIDEQNTGAIEMYKMDCDNLFRKDDPELPDVVFKYVVRYTELATNKKYDVDCHCVDKKVSYSIPGELMHSKIYQLDIIRQTHPKVDEVAESQSKDAWRKLGDWGDGNVYVPLPFNNNPGNGQQGGINDIVLPPQNQNPNIQNGIIMLPPNQQGNQINQNQQMIMINPNNTPNLNNIQANINEGGNNNNPMLPDMNFQNNPDQQMLAMEVYDREFVKSVIGVKITEKVLFTNYFKTSKYKTKAAKLAQMTPHNQVFSTTYSIPPPLFEGYDGGAYIDYEANLIEVPVMLLQTDEGFDVYDVKGYFSSAIKPKYLENYEDQEALYNINPPIFRLEAPYGSQWLEQPYSPDHTNPESIFYNPDEEKFKYWMDIYDPGSGEPFKKVPYRYFEDGDLRPFLFWPDPYDWTPYLSTYHEDEEMEQEGIQKLFWRGDRFKELAYFEHIGKVANLDKYTHPFMKNEFKYVDRVLPRPQQVGMNAEKANFLPAEWYTHNRHDHVNFGNNVVIEPEGILNMNEVNAEKAKAPQQNNPNQMVLQNISNNNINPGIQNAMLNVNFDSNTKRYLAIIDYSEWMTRKEHVRMTNKVLYEFREDVCVGCGTNIVSLLDQQDSGNKQYHLPNDEPKDQGFGENYNEIPPIKWEDFRYSFKYLPMRAWLLHEHRYKPRPQGSYSFRLGDKEFTFPIPQYSQNGIWPSDLNIW